MTTAQLDLFDARPVASARRDDPSSSKEAAASLTEGQTQIKMLLRRLHEGPVTADQAGDLIGRHRSTASARLGVMMRRGLVEKGGFRRKSLRQRVLVYRLTPAGEVEYARMFGGVA